MGVYHTAGANAVWYVDNYDKLKPYGFPVSRDVASYYLDAVEQYRACPVELAKI